MGRRVLQPCAFQAVQQCAGRAAVGLCITQICIPRQQPPLPSTPRIPAGVIFWDVLTGADASRAPDGLSLGCFVTLPVKSFCLASGKITL